MKTLFLGIFTFVLLVGLGWASSADAGALVFPTVTPGTTIGGTATTYTVSFQVASSTEIEAQIRLIFPAGFNVSGATATSSITASSTGSAIVASSTVSGQEVTIWLADGSVTAASETIEIAGIPSIQSPYAGGSHTLGIETRTQANGLSDQASSTAFAILAAAQGTKESDIKPPSSVIERPSAGENIPNSSSYLISGRGSDAEKSAVTQVEVSVDDGATWASAQVNSSGGTYNWEYNWKEPSSGSHVIKVRATDIKGNIESPSTGVSVVVAGAVTPIPQPAAPDEDDSEEETPEQTTIKSLQQQVLSLQGQVVALLQKLLVMLQL